MSILSRKKGRFRPITVVVLKRFGRGGAETPLTQVVSLVLDKLVSGAVVADEGEYAVFRDDIYRLQGMVREDSSPEKIVFTAGSATLVMEAYNNGINGTLQKERRELRSVVTMVAEAMAGIALDNARALEKIKELRTYVERTRGNLDAEALKQRLGDCLKVFREETVRAREDAESEIMALRREIEQGHMRAAPEDLELDAATNLPMKEACVQAMHASIPAGKRRFVVPLVVSRLQAINARFGYEVGNRVLRHFAEFVQQQVHPGDKLFRWRGPALVALLDRSEPLDTVRGQMRRIMESRIEQTFDVEGRSVLIPVSAAWSAFQLITTVAAAEKQIEIFAASQASHEYA